MAQSYLVINKTTGKAVRTRMPHDYIVGQYFYNEGLSVKHLTVPQEYKDNYIIIKVDKEDSTFIDL